LEKIAGDPSPIVREQVVIAVISSVKNHVGAGGLAGIAWGRRGDSKGS
jgi:hypothetical protein